MLYQKYSKNITTYHIITLLANANSDCLCKKSKFVKYYIIDNFLKETIKEKDKSDLCAILRQANTTVIYQAHIK